MAFWEVLLEVIREEDLWEVLAAMMLLAVQREVALVEVQWEKRTVAEQVVVQVEVQWEVLVVATLLGGLEEVV